MYYLYPQEIFCISLCVCLEMGMGRGLGRRGVGGSKQICIWKSFVYAFIYFFDNV